MANFVQLYKSTDFNAPSLMGQVGSLTALLTTVLVTGYVTAGVGNITRASNIATVSLGTANSTLVTGNYVTIVGCAQTDYNGTFQITVINSTTFTYVVANSPATPATGTITYKKAPLGWSVPFTGTNIAAYRSNDVASNRFYLLVNDAGGMPGGALEASVRGYESMTDVYTGIQPFPTVAQSANGICWRKSRDVSVTTRAWTIIGDDKTFYLLTNDFASVGTSNLFGFGSFPSQKPADSFNTFLIGYTNFNTNQGSGALSHGFSAQPVVIGSATTGLYIARPYTQLGSSFNAGICNWVQGWFGNSATLTFPHPVDGGTYLVQPIFHEVTNGFVCIRGRIPGVYHHLHGFPYNHYDQITGVTNLPGVTLTILSFSVGTSSSGQLAFDTFGPWN